MEDKQPVSESSFVSAAWEPLLTTPPPREGRSVVPPPEPEIVPIAATPVPEPELSVEVGDRPTTGHLDLEESSGNRTLFG